MTDIPYRVKNNYGLDLNYPTDPNQIEALKTLTGRKTLNDHDMAALRQLGFEPRQVM